MSEENHGSIRPLSGKTCLVTGATSGIGLATARALAGMGASLIVLGRDPGRAERALASIREAASDPAPACAQSGGASLSCDLLDLSDLKAVTDYASAFAARLGERGLARRLDVLVNCAGTYTDRRSITVDGYEAQFAVNHLAHFCLGTGLLPLLEAAPDGRIITVSSGSHYYGRIRWKELEGGRGGPYIGIRAYSQSKLANVLFSAGLAHRYPTGRPTVFTADPGLVDTDMGAKQGFSLGSIFWSLRRRGGTRAEVPAAAIAWLASEPSLAGRTGLYWKDGVVLEPSKRGKDQADAERLWALSESLAGGALSRRNKA